MNFISNLFSFLKPNEEITKKNTDKIFLKEIIILLESKKFKPWSSRKKGSGFYIFMKSSVRKILKLISGNDTFGLLNSILRISEKKKLSEKKDNKILRKKVSKYERVLNNFSSLSNLQKKNEKYKFIQPLRKAKMTLKSCNDLGFTCQSGLWKSCLNAERKKGTKIKI